MHDSKKRIIITADIIHQTEHAVLINDSDTEVWLPLNLIEFDGEPGDEAVDIELPEWLANKKGLI